MFTGDTPPMKLFLILYQTDLMRELAQLGKSMETF